MSQMTLEDALTETRAICELVAGDPMHAAERQAVIDAIRLVADRDGVVNVNAVRPHIPTWVNPRVTSATYNALIARKLLVSTGERTPSTDTKGREGSHRMLTWDDVLDLAVKAYWQNRPMP